MSDPNSNYLLQIIDKSVAPICTLLAGYFGVRFGWKQIIEQKKLDFIERQLREFYSPMLGCRKEIQAKSLLRLRISEVSDQSWKELCDQNPRPFLGHDKAFEPYKRSIEYDNDQFKNELMPLYEKMLKIFNENFWLAEPETAKWYSKFCDYVELWRRWMSKNIPADVIKKIDSSEAQLLPFYEELEKRLLLLRERLKGS